MADLANLLVDLSDARFDAQARANALRAADRAGLRIAKSAANEDAFQAWIDEQFGGAWSSEAAAAPHLIASAREACAGFVCWESRAIPYGWLRAAAQEPGLGFFGPFGLAAPHRKTPLGPALLTLALCALRECGFTRALVPAVQGEGLLRYFERHAGAAIARRFPIEPVQRPYRALVMASGSGSNAQSVIDGAERGDLPLEIVAVISNRASAGVLERARRADISSRVVSWDRAAQSRAEHDAQIFEIVSRHEPDLVLLLGWMHLLDRRFVERFAGRTINIHPAFLPLDQRTDEVTFPDGSVTPAFRGARALRDALTWGSRWVGASAHGVTLEEDRGPVLVRKPLAVHAGENEEALLSRLHPLEHATVAQAILRWSRTR